MREALTSYIEATYHLSHPKAVGLRRALLMEGGVAQTPFIESTPAYVSNRQFASLALDERVRDFLTSLASKESGELLFNPPYEHQAQALEATIHANAGGTGITQLGRDSRIRGQHRQPARSFTVGGDPGVGRRQSAADWSHKSGRRSFDRDSRSRPEPELEQYRLGE